VEEGKMEYTHLGRTGLKVSRLCLGTMNFGPLTAEADSFAIMDEALELGLNFFDTANVYGWKMGEGITEQIVGRWFAQGGRRREKVALATKVYGRMSTWPNDSRLSAYHIRRACEESLRRLRTDHIDLYQMHHIDRDSPWEEIWQAMGCIRVFWPVGGRLRPRTERRPPMSNPEAELEARLMADAKAAIAKALAERPAPAEATLADIERAARRAGQHIEQAIATALAQESAAELTVWPTCPQCGQKMKHKGKRHRRIVTEAGEIEVERTYYHCAACRQGIFPPG